MDAASVRAHTPDMDASGSGAQPGGRLASGRVDVATNNDGADSGAALRTKGPNMTSLAPVIAELDRLYAAMTDALFPEPWQDAMRDNTPVIAVSSRGRKRTVNAWYVPSVWNDVTDDLLDALSFDGATNNRVETKRAECVLASELLRSEPLDIAAELTRTMLAHHLAIAGKVADVPGESNYYPRRWRDYATTVGLVASVNDEQPSKGWSRITRTPAFDSIVTPLLNVNAFDISRDGVSDRTAQANRMLKYACDCTVVRSATFVDATCNACGMMVEYADKAKVPNALKLRGTYVSTNEDDNPRAIAYTAARLRDEAATTTNGVTA